MDVLNACTRVYAAKGGAGKEGKGGGSTSVVTPEREKVAGGDVLVEIRGRSF